MKTKFQKGISIIELVLVVAAVSFLALLINNLPASISAINKSRHTSIAKNVANKQMEYLRSRSFTNLANGTNPFSNTELSKLPESAAQYLVEDCPGTVCTNTENAKKVTVSVSWKEAGETKSVELVTLVGEGGIGQ